LASLLEAASPLSAVGGGLRELDELLRDADARGFVFVQARGEALEAAARHVARRARLAGRALLAIERADDPFRELLARLAIHAVPDALGAAQAILDRAGSLAILVQEGTRTAFARALADELARLCAEGASPALVIALTERAPDATAARVIEIDGGLASDEVALWWDAVARDPSVRVGAGLDRLDALEAWWSAARATPADARPAPVPLSAEASRLLARVQISQRSWLAAQIGKLGSLSAAQELVRTGALALDAQGRLVAGGAVLPGIAPDRADERAVAEALDPQPDPWAQARASELFAAAGDFDRAEDAALRALGTPCDAAARADFWRRWEATLAAMPDAEGLPRLVRSAELALRAGEIERALELAGAAIQKRPDSFATLLALGRANVARGDLPTANYWLGKALARSASPVERAQVEVELAEVRHMAGDVEGARAHAEAVLGALADATGPAAQTRLHARNVLGKLLLSTSMWQRAEEHFAADACEARLAGDLTAELRARLNRSIALLSSGRLDEARVMLGAVLDEGEARGELRAVAYALTNLATIAIIKREYPEALRISERAFDARRRLGDKVSLALLITNLAELKLQLGLVSEAEQALAFGRKACGPSMPGSRASHFAFTAALVHFERGRTVEAAAELRAAIAVARGSTNGARLGECYRLAARIALEDGDLAAAESALAQAAQAAETPRERAWVAVLDAAHARAAGEPFGEAAQIALDRARAADDPEIVREAHVLLHHAAVIDGDPRAARAHLESAVAMRDQIADSLPDDLRRRFLARRDLVDLQRLVSEASAAWRTTPPPPDSLSIRVPEAPVSVARRVEVAPVPALRRMVGRTPAMAALATAIQKVGQSDATVLVHGESGTGKELVAEAIHEASARRAGPLVKVNCAALVETLLLSELFGHEKGSFTGAAARRRGRFEVAEGGTLFLDEIGDISPRTQVALLRVLQEKTFERVGGVTPIRANVRIVCATHRDLAAMVARGEFREDLYYRLRGVVLEVPALRQRVADLPLVAAAILERIAVERGTAQKRLSPAAIDALAHHTWPGNIRELENALRAAALFAEGEVIELDDFTMNVDSLRSLAVTLSPAHPQAAPNPAPPAASQGSTSGPLSAPFLRVPGPVQSLPAAVTPPGPVTLSSAALAAMAAGIDGMRDACEFADMAPPSKNALPSQSGGNATDAAYAAIRSGVSLGDLKRDIERECIARALAEAGGNITRAAGLLGMKRPRLSQLVKQYGFGPGAGGGAGSDADVDAEDGE
jgi:transcriptional regulator with GAF, ATPase, and Fis domain/tetratricopeptide (TPR) repeat protein